MSGGEGDRFGVLSGVACPTDQHEADPGPDPLPVCGQCASGHAAESRKQKTLSTSAISAVPPPGDADPVVHQVMPEPQLHIDEKIGCGDVLPQGG